MAAADRTPAEDLHVQRARINFSWILKLRWAAVIGQLVTVLGVQWGLGIELPLGPLLAIVLVEAVSNAALEWWFRGQLHRDAWARHYERGETLLGSVMVGDVGLLTALLYLTGGPANPFSIFYLVNIVLVAVVLQPIWAWGVAFVALAGYVSLFWVHRPLDGLPEWGFGGTVGLYAWGMLTAIAGSITLVVSMVVRVTSELGKLEHELEEERRRKERGERLEALATLAAGAAHELASPLSTIAVVAKELAIDLERNGPEGAGSSDAVADAHLIRDEVARCRVILDQMSIDAGSSRMEGLSNVSLEEILDTALEGLARREQVDLELGPELAGRTLFVAQRTLALALRGVIKNALDASSETGRVRVGVGLDGEVLTVEVRDQGSGMPPEVVERATDPFFTTKEPGQGMGLGLYLSRTVIERLEGSLEFDSAQRRGTTARIRIPTARISQEPASGA